MSGVRIRWELKSLLCGSSCWSMVWFLSPNVAPPLQGPAPWKPNLGSADVFTSGGSETKKMGLVLSRSVYGQGSCHPRRGIQ